MRSVLPCYHPRYYCRRASMLRASMPAIPVGATRVTEASTVTPLRTVLKWLGAVMVVGGIAAFPAAIWFRGPWGVITLLLVMAGSVVLLLARVGLPANPGEGQGDSAEK